MKKRILSALLAVVLCISLLPTAAFARETDCFFDLPAYFDYDSVSFDDSCVEETIDACDEALSLLGNIVNVDKLSLAYEKILALDTEVQTQAALITVLYYQNSERYATQYSNMMADMDRSDQKVLRTLQQIFSDGECGATMRSYAGEAQVEAVMSEKVPSERQLALSRQETALTMEYQKADTEETTFIYDHKVWTIDKALEAYYAGKLTAAQYYEILYGVYAKRSQQLGEIYLKLVEVRREIALEAGYEDYNHYAYDKLYMRDYSPEDVAAYSEAVKEYIVPLYKQMNQYYRLGCFSESHIYGACDTDGLIAALEPYADDISSEVADSLAYLQECHLADADHSDTKLPVCFTTTLPAYNSAYVFCSRTGEDRDLNNFIHEFGHFNALIYDAGGSDYDTMEVHSQGMEMLYLRYAEELYGDVGKNKVGYNLYETLYLVLVGCAYDSLQQYAYTTPGLTVEAMNRKSAELAAEYGLYTYGPEGLDYSWVDISHNFDSPLYYISYSTSALVALEIYRIGCESGLEAAADQYLQFVAWSGVIAGFRSVTLQCGLGDPFSADTVRELAEAFPECLESQFLSMPFADAENSWAKDDIVLLDLLGIMNGVSEDSFAPNATLSRAMAVTVLYRLCGCPEVSGNAAERFTDVASESWYTDAVAWAVKRGVILGTTETTFSPDNSLSCQEFAVMLYRLLGGSGELEDDAGTGADPWAAGAVLWCSDNGIFESERGSVSPRSALTRAELAAALVNFLNAV